MLIEFAISMVELFLLGDGIDSHVRRDLINWVSGSLPIILKEIARNLGQGTVLLTSTSINNGYWFGNGF